MCEDSKIFYIKVMGYKKGPRYYGPYSTKEFNPDKTLLEFCSGLENSYTAEIKWKLNKSL